MNNTVLIACIIGIAIIALTVMFAIVVITGRKIAKALTEESTSPAPDPIHKLPVAAYDTAGQSDPYIVESYFTIGLLGPPRPFSKEDPPKPEPFIGVVFQCPESQQPNSVVLTYSLLEGIWNNCQNAVLVATRSGQTLRLDAQIPVIEQMAEDIKEKLNLYGRMELKIRYQIYFKGSCVERDATSQLRWRSHLGSGQADDDQDLSAYVAQYRS